MIESRLPKKRGYSEDSTELLENNSISTTYEGATQRLNE